MERKILADGVYYRNWNGELRREEWTVTNAHDRIDSLFERVEELQAQWDSHFDDEPKPHTCGECIWSWSSNHPHTAHLVCWKGSGTSTHTCPNTGTPACDKFEPRGEA